MVQGDFLQFRLPDRAYKVFANVPYSRTSAIVQRLVQASSTPSDAYLVVQREAGQRFAGEPYAAETLASLSLKPWWQVEIARRLRRSDFDPPPSVESVMLWLARRKRPLVSGAQRLLYLGFVASAFGRRGNTVRQCLREVFTGREISLLARDLTFDPGAQPSALSFDRWLGLFGFLVLKARPVRAAAGFDAAARSGPNVAPAREHT